MSQGLGLNRIEAAAFIQRRIGRKFLERTLRHWESRHLLKPTPAKCRGPYHPTSYGVRDLVAAEILATLRIEGASLQKLRRGLNALERFMPGVREWPGEWRLAVTSGGDVVRVESDQQLLDLTRKPGQIMFVLNAGDIAREVRELIEHKKRTG